jgi:hypothetical protein
MVRECCDGRLKHISTAQVRAEQQSKVTPEQRKILESVRNSTERSEGFPLPTLAQAITYAIAHCFQNESVVKDYELYEAILQHSQGTGVDLEQMKAAVASHPGVILGTHGEVSSALHYRLELESNLWIEQVKGKGDLLPIGGKKMNRLSEPQRKAVKRLLESRDQFSALSGSAGVGKTEFVIAQVIEANLKAGHQVAVVSPSDDARNVLRQDAEKLSHDSPAFAVLKRAESLQLFQADPRLHERLGRGDLLIVDEASFMSLNQGHKSLEQARERGVRLLFVGDLSQGKSIEAGDFFRLAIKSGVHTSELHDIKRQSPKALDGHYLKAVKLFKTGRTTEAFAELHKAGCIHESKGQKRVEAVAEEIIRSEAAGVQAMAVNPSHRENDAIGAAVRRRMKEVGQLSNVGLGS